MKRTSKKLYVRVILDENITPSDPPFRITEPQNGSFQAITDQRIGLNLAAKRARSL
jgi:hypothetical protein